MNSIRFFTEEDVDCWDRFLKSLPNFAFQHTRQFLEYHFDRFVDRSLIITSDKGDIVCCFPCAVSLSNERVIISHPGATYGGMCLAPNEKGIKVVQILEGVLGFLKKAGYAKIIYKPLPWFYQNIPNEDELYALFRLGFKLVRRDLSTLLRFKQRGFVSSRRKRSLNKAKKIGEVTLDVKYLDKYWEILTSNLKTKHNVNPVHSIAEIKDLMRRFPSEIEFVGVLINLSLEAGIINFKYSSVWHNQYTSASEVGKEESLLDLAFDYTFTKADSLGIPYFDFGVSTKKSGEKLNEGLYQYKTEFGGGGVCYDQYEIEL